MTEEVYAWIGRDGRAYRMVLMEQPTDVQLMELEVLVDGRWIKKTEDDINRIIGGRMDVP